MDGWMDGVLRNNEVNASLNLAFCESQQQQHTFQRYLRSIPANCREWWKVTLPLLRLAVLGFALLSFLAIVPASFLVTLLAFLALAFRDSFGPGLAFPFLAFATFLALPLSGTAL